MPWLHFIFLLYAVVTLEGLRPQHIPVANQSFSHLACIQDGALKLDRSDVVKAQPVLQPATGDGPVFFVDSASIVILSFSRLELPLPQAHTRTAKPAKGEYYYSFSGLSPPRIS